MSDDIDERLLDHLISLHKWTAIACELIGDHSYADFSSNRQLELSVSKAIEMIGEVSGRILKGWPGWAGLHPELEFANAYGMRNRLAHGYDSVDLATVWLTVIRSVPEMNARVAELLQKFDELDP